MVLVLMNSIVVELKLYFTAILLYYLQFLSII